MFWKKKPKAQITLFNTLGRKKEVFEPLKGGHVKMYSCGPTVYDYAHVGNLRAAVFPDLVRRTLEYAGYKVAQVMNITDFGHLTSDADEGEDKMTLALKREGKELTMENMFAVAGFYAEAFKKDISALNVETPRVMPRASEHVNGMIAYIKTLLEKGYAYKTSDGVYFDVQKFPAYGVLGGSASHEHSRIGANSEKHDPRDFALWKLNPSMGWDAPWGKGFPGWHIECTAMSTRYLGTTFDIHTGGIDHIPIHHTNEIAQSEAANGKPYARYWMHNEFITIDSTKLSKSLGNTITLRQLIDRGIHPLSYRYWLLTGHYRQAVNFTWEAVQAAQTARERALRVFADLPQGPTLEQDPKVGPYLQRFADRIYDDLNTPEAVAVMWELIKDEKVAPGVKRATLLDFDRVLAIGFSSPQETSKVAVSQVPEEVRALATKREIARKAGDWATADTVRAEIEKSGYLVEDTAKGSILKKSIHNS
jgi:cysteinyl-tRNA synthetase